MPSIRSRADNGLLFFDFRFQGDRCREQTLLSDTPANRKKLEKVLAKIEAEIAAGTFVYANYFPNSKALARLEKAAGQAVQIAVAPVGVEAQHTAIDGGVGAHLHRSVGILGVDKGRRSTEELPSVPAVIQLIRSAFLTE